MNRKRKQIRGKTGNKEREEKRKYEGRGKV